MLVILNPNTDETTEDFKITWEYLLDLPEVHLQKHKVKKILIYREYFS